MYFLRKLILHFPSKEQISFFPEKIIIFPGRKNIIFKLNFFGKTIFSGHLKEILYFHVFFWKTSSLIFRLKKKIYHLSR